MVENPLRAETVAQQSEESPVCGWDVEGFGARLSQADAAGQVFVLRGLSAGALMRDVPALRAALMGAGMPIFVLDPTGACGTSRKFFDILVTYLNLAEQRGMLSEDARHLFEFITSSDDRTISGLFPAVGGKLYNDTLCRLWTALTLELPAALLVVNAHHLADCERKTLEHLNRYFFSDPIAQLTPELHALDRGMGRLLVLAEGDALPLGIDRERAVEVDLSQSAAATVRQFLNDPQVIERFIRSTGGDTERLGQLLEGLPADVRHFWRYRYQKLDALQRGLVSILAVAVEPVPVDMLHEVAQRLGDDAYFTRTINELSTLGFIERRIAAGALQLHVANRELADSILELLPEEERRAIHRALGDAGAQREDGAQWTVFLARHYIAAGDAEAGFTYGRRAVRWLMGRREFEPARALLDALLELMDRDEERAEIHANLIEVHSGLGNSRKALAHCAQLGHLVDGEVARLRLRCQTAGLLSLIGEYTRALDAFDAVVEATRGEPEHQGFWLEAQLGQAEALFSLGQHDRADTLARELIQLLSDPAERTAQLGGVGQAATDMGLIKARNLVGKVAILRGECPGGRELFDSNYALACQWGWDDEAARAEANLGLVALQQKDFSDALERLERAQRMVRSPAALRRAYIFINLGIVHQRKAHYDDALRHYLEGLRAARQEGDEAGYAMAAYNLVTLYQDMGAFERAQAMIEHLRAPKSGQAPSQFLGELPTVVHGSILLDAQDYAGALQALGCAGEASEQSSAASLPAREVQLRAIEAHLALGQRAPAEQILADFERAGDDSQPQLGALAQLGRASLALDAQDFDAALSACNGAAEMARAAGHHRDALRIARVVATALTGLGRTAEACALLEGELRRLQQRALGVPEAYRTNFFLVPVHQQLVGLVRQLSGEVPAEFRVSQSKVAGSAARSGAALRAGEPREATDLQDPAFRRWRSRYRKIVGEAPRLHQLFRILDRVAASDASVLLLGESGTGKELLAEAVHQHSGRAQKPFIKVNCAAFVEDLLLSELFGHVKGAFTGAIADKPGRFELADGGTLFLDEVGDLSAKAQVALLRVLQEGSFERVGGSETRTVDVRLVCATNRNLEEMVQRGEFRLDLFYRLKGVVMEVPPLRERRADIARLAFHFVREFAGAQPPKTFAPDVLHFLTSYSWPGNIRELQNFVRSILLFVEGDTIEMVHINDLSDFFAGGSVDLELPQVDVVLEPATHQEAGEVFEDPEQALVAQIIAEGLSLAKIKARLEFESIRRALIETDGNITRAAEMLQMKRPRLSQIVNSSDELVALRDKLVG